MKENGKGKKLKRKKGRKIEVWWVKKRKMGSKKKLYFVVNILGSFSNWA